MRYKSKGYYTLVDGMSICSITLKKIRTTLKSWKCIYPVILLLGIYILGKFLQVCTSNIAYNNKSIKATQMHISGEWIKIIVIYPMKYSISVITSKP